MSSKLFHVLFADSFPLRHQHFLPNYEKRWNVESKNIVRCLTNSSSIFAQNDAFFADDQSFVFYRLNGTLDSLFCVLKQTATRKINTSKMCRQQTRTEVS
jgi:hypothetical protein